MKLKKEENCYFINSKKRFKAVNISKKTILKSFEFAYEMAYGKGYHRCCRSGGTKLRSKAEIFFNTLQGKVSEFILHEIFTTKKYNCSGIDVSIEGKGQWDEVDLIINSKKINIKSTAFFSNLLLLETKDWDTKGNYIPNSTSYDYFVLVRIKPNTNVMHAKINGLKKKEIIAYLLKQKWFYDIPGCFSHTTLIHLINKEYILPKNALLNGKTKMDATNYYIQSGSLKKLDYLFEVLNNQ